MKYITTSYVDDLAGPRYNICVMKVTLETVTPLFLAGAHPRGEPEFRAASLRGALRFWLRALLGGMLGIEDLREAESAVFGSTKGASPLVIRLTGQSSNGNFATYSDITKDSQGKDSQGVAYLFFAARATKQEKKERKAIPSGSRLQLTIAERVPYADRLQQIWPKAYAALWLLTHLGGLGTRSRRGAGSLQAIAVKHEGEPLEGLPPLTVAATSPAELCEELKSGLAQLRRKALGNPAQVARQSDDLPSFDVIHPGVSDIWVLEKPFGDWQTAVAAVGDAMRDFRTRREPDYSLVKSALQGNDKRKPGTVHQPIRRAAFGLPIVFHFRSLGGNKATLQGDKHDRRASPLLVRVTKLANGQCAVVLTLFRTELLPDSGPLKLTLEPPLQYPVPDFGILEEFLDHLKNSSLELLEVKDW